MNQNLGTGFTTFTRKIPFDNCVKPNYKVALKNRIISASDSVRQVLFRAQIFVNHYIILHSSEVIPAQVFQQGFWYSVCQLVNNKRITNGAGVPSDLIAVWNGFKNTHQSIVYDVNLNPGVASCLSEACIQVATAYLNAVVERFEKCMLFYLYYTIQNLWMVNMKNKL